ncbi:MAG: glutamine--fructose-6-phosphate transaminase (isomerizing) [Armatimonadota bacterium]|nr:glutamine--fructose-6-phosphate transaminase (isomerizing) [Armatimonadota bacterium]MDR5702191.1 glutamine--fructose-6-phosphate transaminase (isomerizing) [Armatimonadota bacterium]
MCGIMGYIGGRDALPILLDGLRRLEYRGYDSAGVAVYTGERLEIRKAAGKLRRLVEMVSAAPVQGTVGIGHTRWATHGNPTDYNAHPHSDCSGHIVVIHNGIIENFLELKEELHHRGHRFQSETDTEVLAHLIEEAYEGNLERAVRHAISRARGAYAIVVLSSHEPDKLIACRQISPLIVGLGDGETWLASDIPALLPYTRKVMVIEDGEMATITRDGVRITTLNGEVVEKTPIHVTWDAEMAERGGYPHFMLKEIHEQPRALQETLMGRLDHAGQISLDGVSLPDIFVERLEKVWLVACGTAYHAGLVGKWLLEHLSRIPAEADLASELRYRDPLVFGTNLTVAISQSGETADTLAAVREMKARGSRILAITNVVGSTLTREADDVLYIRAGPEIAVASTKAYLTMLVALTMLAIELGRRRKAIPDERLNALLYGLRELPGKAQDVLRREPEVLELAKRYAHCQDIFFIGRGLDYAIAMEGSLKLKEISYVHSEALAAGELKHGTLALVTDGVPVFALCTQRHVREKMLSNIQEVKARGAMVVAVAYEDDREVASLVDHVIPIPPVDDLLSPILAIIPLQLFAYYVARERGHDIDQPRNLAKSVTVE